jgi:uncharacterized protein YegP (UPF0339 family)
MEAGIDNDIFLDMVVCKSGGKTDENGNYIFEVEASNEDLDLQGQVVLQRALLASKDHFLTEGVISYDHLHKRRGPNGETISDSSMVIGEPIEVKTDGRRTIVVGKLYKSNETARDLIQKLKDGSTRIRASVGGIFPKIVKDVKTGIEKVTSVLWNDLALTFAPVNSHVSPVVLARSMTSSEFVKALTAGSGTDHAEFAGGRALAKEEVGTKVFSAVPDAADEEAQDKIRSLLAALNTGEVEGREESVRYLVKQGMNSEQARAAVREILSLMEGKS